MKENAKILLINVAGCLFCYLLGMGVAHLQHRLDYYPIPHPGDCDSPSEVGRVYTETDWICTYDGWRKAHP